MKCYTYLLFADVIPIEIHTSGTWGVHKILLALNEFNEILPSYCGVQVNCCPSFPHMLIDLGEIRYNAAAHGATDRSRVP